MKLKSYLYRRTLVVLSNIQDDSEIHFSCICITFTSLKDLQSACSGCRESFLKLGFHDIHLHFKAMPQPNHVV